MAGDSFALEAKLLGRDVSMSKAFDKVAAAAEKASKRVSATEQRLQKFEKTGKTMQSVGKSMTAGITLPLIGLGTVAVLEAKKFESAFAGVQKTFPGTAAELAKVRQGIIDMSKEIPASREQISGVAESAGQLGIKSNAILGFTRTMIDLGEATNLSASDAATQLARLANITQMPQDKFDELGSTVVKLGNNLATTESEIVEMGLRIAGAGKQVGLSEHQILALSGALSSVGIEAEAGGTAISQSMKQMNTAVMTGGKSLDAFAKVARMAPEAFQTVWKRDAAQGMVAFVQGLQRIKAAGGDVSAALSEAGIKGIRAQDAWLRLAGSGDALQKSLKLGAVGWRENNALTDEAAQRYATFDSQLKIFQNEVTDVGRVLGEALIPALLDAMTAAQPLIDKFAELAKSFADAEPGTQKLILGLAAIAAAAGPAIWAAGTLLRSYAAIRLAIIGKAAATAVDTAATNANTAANTANAASSSAAGKGFANARDGMTGWPGMLAIAGTALTLYSANLSRNTGELSSWHSVLLGATSAMNPLMFMAGRLGFAMADGTEEAERNAAGMRALSQELRGLGDRDVAGLVNRWKQLENSMDSETLLSVAAASPQLAEGLRKAGYEIDMVDGKLRRLPPAQLRAEIAPLQAQLNIAQARLNSLKQAKKPNIAAIDKVSKQVADMRSRINALKGKSLRFNSNADSEKGKVLGLGAAIASIDTYIPVTIDVKKVGAAIGVTAGRAIGGAGGTVARVGERGPEIVTLPEGAHVFTHSQSRQMGGLETFAKGKTPKKLTPAQQKRRNKLQKQLDGAKSRLSQFQSETQSAITTSRGFATITGFGLGDRSEAENEVAEARLAVNRSAVGSSERADAMTRLREAQSKLSGMPRSAKEWMQQKIAKLTRWRDAMKRLAGSWGKTPGGQQLLREIFDQGPDGGLELAEELLKNPADLKQLATMAQQATSLATQAASVHPSTLMAQQAKKEVDRLQPIILQIDGRNVHKALLRVKRQQGGKALGLA